MSADDPFAALASIIAKVPIWVFHSEADQTAPVEQARRLAAALKAVGADARYTEYQGLDHQATGQKFPTEPEFFPLASLAPPQEGHELIELIPLRARADDRTTCRIE